MHWLQRSHLKTARAWRIKMALREVYARANQSNDPDSAQADLKHWLGWAKRSRLPSFMCLVRTIAEHFDGVVRGMLDKCSNAYVKAMNGLLQQVKRAARGFRTAKNFIAIAHLSMGKLKDFGQRARSRGLSWVMQEAIAMRSTCQVPHGMTRSRPSAVSTRQIFIQLPRGLRVRRGSRSSWCYREPRTSKYSAVATRHVFICALAPAVTE